MSRLMTGILLVALLGLTISMAWAQGRPDGGVGGSDIITYDTTTPPNPSIDEGFPLEATATFKAHVLAYAHLAIDPPKDLVVPGDSVAGTPGEDSIEPEISGEPNPDAGLITAEFNTACKLSVEVSEFAGDGTVIPDEKLWTAYKFGALSVKFWENDPLWVPVAFLPPPVDDGWFQIANTFHNFGDPDMPAGAKAGTGIGTLVIDQYAFSPVANQERYMRLPFGVKAKNRIDSNGDYTYETLALAGDYTATMVATLAAP